jgi:hypothetical protein
LAKPFVVVVVVVVQIENWKKRGRVS